MPRQDPLYRVISLAGLLGPFGLSRSRPTPPPVCSSQPSSSTQLVTDINLEALSGGTVDLYPEYLPAKRLTEALVLVHDIAVVATEQSREVVAPPTSRLTVINGEGATGSPVVKL